jgi:hypothetical protein
MTFPFVLAIFLGLNIFHLYIQAQLLFYLIYQVKPSFLRQVDFQLKDFLKKHFQIAVINQYHYRNLALVFQSQYH